jgi:hypothetical protein
MTFPLAILEFRLGFFETVFWTNLGGLIGIFIFAFLSEQIIFLWKNYIGKYFLFIFNRKKFHNPPPKKLFTRKNRKIIRIKNRYGLIGIAMVTPVLLSIPVGVFLVIRYFNQKKGKFAILFSSNIIWSFVYTFFYFYCYDYYISLIERF